jgi:hypothetical protein
VKAVAQTLRVLGRCVKIALKMAGQLWSRSSAQWVNEHLPVINDFQIDQAATLALYNERYEKKRYKTQCTNSYEIGLL